MTMDTQATPEMAAVVDAARVLRRVGLLASARYSGPVEIAAVDGLRIALRLFDEGLPHNNRPTHQHFNTPRVAS
jgi:hypothetical protein